DGAFDMSGNVREWTDETHGDTGAPNYTPIYVTRGGSYLSGTQGLSCTNTLSQASAVTTLPSLGFRCCSSAAP
ncbi:MAG TPA: SUMF1/EgtB/PvdO family nonheme iron enzyme, partial [Polyangiales bacterium]|nr:SUMF1/EgtB/PvdO family nonheme iron enzyme [Polyangiales bacterium]